MSTWNLKECSTFLQYKKKDGDAAMPPKVVDRRKRCEDVKSRASPCCSPHASDDEEDNEEDNAIAQTQNGGTMNVESI